MCGLRKSAAGRRPARTTPSAPHRRPTRPPRKRAAPRAAARSRGLRRKKRAPPRHGSTSESSHRFTNLAVVHEKAVRHVGERLQRLAVLQDHGAARHIGARAHHAARPAGRAVREQDVQRRARQHDAQPVVRAQRGERGGVELVQQDDGTARAFPAGRAPLRPRGRRRGPPPHRRRAPPAAFSGRCLRARSRRTAASLRASHAR